MICDRCGTDSKVTAAVEIRWSFQMEDGRTLFGAVLNPDSAKRTLCADCFADLCEATAVRLGVSDG